MAKNKDQITVYPAYAGVILLPSYFTLPFVSLSRIRGGDPKVNSAPVISGKFIPHTRGWSSISRSPFTYRSVYPAYAGVILADWVALPVLMCLSRIRGGDPISVWLAIDSASFIPHTRGWSLMLVSIRVKKSVYPAYAGVILQRLAIVEWYGCLSRIRGGDPINFDLIIVLIAFIPHTRGWSYILNIYSY